MSNNYRTSPMTYIALMLNLTLYLKCLESKLCLNRPPSLATVLYKWTSLRMIPIPSARKGNTTRLTEQYLTWKTPGENTRLPGCSQRMNVEEKELGDHSSSSLDLSTTKKIDSFFPICWTLLSFSYIWLRISASLFVLLTLKKPFIPW